MVTMIWYLPPGFYQYIYIAVVMAVDLGLSEKPKDGILCISSDFPTDS